MSPIPPTSLTQSYAVKFFAGQWLDTFVPDIPKAGGFTITSTPEDARGGNPEGAYLELAVQKSPKNPPAAWLWQPMEKIRGKTIYVRVGGSFIWPPPRARQGAEVRRLVLIAGGVGINPLISIIGHLHKSDQMPSKVTVLYSTRLGNEADGSDILFLSRIRDLVGGYSKDMQVEFQLYLTGSEDGKGDMSSLPDGTRARRISHDDIERAVGSQDHREAMVCYICGPQKMTDEFVEHVQGLPGVDPRNVLCEKWW